MSAVSTVVVLTQTFSYWGERPLHDALKLLVKGKAEIVSADESREIRAGINKNGIVFKIPAPLVIRLLNFVGIHIKNEEIIWSKEAVYERDKNICGYYHKDSTGRRFRYRCLDSERTIDHIVPRFRGGKSTFINTVCACISCNVKHKKGRTPKEAGMELIRLPEVPKRRKGDMVIITFKFNPGSKAHQALVELMPNFKPAK